MNSRSREMIHRLHNAKFALAGVKNFTALIPLRLVAVALGLILLSAMPTHASVPAKKLPATPVSLSASAASTSQINLAWQPGDTSQSGFTIQRGSTSSGPWTTIATVGATATSYANTGLGSATTYYYHVCAYNSWGSSAYAGPVSATTMCTDTISTSVSPAGTGTASGGGTYNCNSSVTVTA